MTHGDDPNLHVIRDGRFLCLGDRSSACHQYPDCECEQWSEEHDSQHLPVTHDDCWAFEWITAADLEDSFEGDRLDLDADGRWPDGAVEITWQGDYLTWDYAAATGLTAEATR